MKMMQIHSKLAEYDSIVPFLNIFDILVEIN